MIQKEGHWIEGDGGLHHFLVLSYEGADPDGMDMYDTIAFGPSVGSDNDVMRIHYGALMGKYHAYEPSETELKTAVRLLMGEGK
jgi:hypothetical protein